jgi:glycosyltransferase involved in cell wall biosynthesis
MTADSPIATVVVPTRDRPDALARCLDALAAQTAGPLDVVVVDDGSTDRAAVAARVAAHPGVRLVHGSGRGPAAARNLGAEHTAAPILCFTDDDCEPLPGWAAALLSAPDLHCGAAAGPTRAAPSAGRCAAAAQVITNHLVTWSADQRTGTVAFAPTSNLAVGTPLFRERPFDDAFPLAAGEDRDWCDRLARAGATIAFRSDAVVVHHPALDLRGLWRQQSRYGRGGRQFRRAQPGRGLPGWGFYRSLLAAGFREGPAVGLLVVVAQVATAVGVARDAIATRLSARGAARPR